jgi:hypothetical protein
MANRDKGFQMADDNVTWLLGRERRFVTKFLLVSCFVTLLALAGMCIFADTKAEQKEKVFNIILPVLGTWVGTLLAFYFSRENFESATKSVANIAGRLTNMDKLRTVPVVQKMIPRKDITTLSDELNRKQGSLTLKEITGYMEEQRISRLPIFEDNWAFKYIIHKSAVDEFKSARVNNPPQGATIDSLARLTLGDMLAEEKYRRLFTSSVGITPVTATLADAKQKMDNIPDCDDVFVTETGDKREPVLGWITNDVLIESAEV